MLREVRRLVQGHTDAKWWGQDPNPGLYEYRAPSHHFFTASNIEAEEHLGNQPSGLSVWSLDK